MPLPATKPEQLHAIARGDVMRCWAGLADRQEARLNGRHAKLLTGQTRLPGFHGEWKVCGLGEIARIKTGAATRGREEGNIRSLFDRAERINSYFDCEAS
jgi:type I restriction enzyme S subunit